MTEHIFKEIRSIEQEAASITSDAEKKAEEILKKANEESIKLRSEKDSELIARRESELKKASQAAARLKQKKIEKAAADIKGLKVTADRKKNEAVSLVLDRLSKRIGE